jgi:hypothetical protein
MNVSLLFRVCVCLAVAGVAGCVTPPSADSDILAETDDQRSTRRVFKDDWLRPSVTKEDYDFFYKNFFWGGK